jgi:asparagine synthetase B (glutamine-hydrolysing)
VDIYPGMDKIGQYDTLLSCSFYDKEKFIAYTDYMGIIRHYYYSDNESFFASNNSFLVALLVEANIAPEAIYETLFFRFPYKTGTFFQNVRALDPFEYIEYNTQIMS